ncbi:MAG: LL-diaminopimelate aminotransferase [Deltaproteobacteria bacterium]|nr:LL-diaminopimelate aminotransferase [Deltaproteobacteria bacterium]
MANESYIQNLIAGRIGGNMFGKDTKIYKFEKIKRAKAAAKEAHPGVELIDMGVGEPDEMAFPGVVKMLQLEAEKPENRGYADNGIDELKKAATLYMDKVFGVKGLDAKREVVHSIGSKPALAMMASAFINPGDVMLMTAPGYPVTATHTSWYGGEVHNLPLLEENGFLPDLKGIPADIAKKAKLLYLNYPNNPTGAQATKEFYEEAIAWAKENSVVIIQDAAYGALVYEKNEPLSILSIEGAKEVAVEIHSFSKAYNMTGWRLAFVCGNPLVVSAFANVKDNYDSGQFIPIQKAGIYCLEHPEITEAIAAKYERRLKMLVDALNSVGFKASMPGGTFYLYVKAPKGVKGGPRFDSGEDFSQYLIKEKLISTVPWDDAGNFVRFAACFIAEGAEEEKRVIEEIKKRLSDVNFEF